MKNILRILICALALVMMFSLCACAKDGSGDDTTADSADTTTAEQDTTKEEETTEEKRGFKVTVKDQNGDPVSAVMVQICKEACIPARTDETGTAIFMIDEITSEHKLSIMAAPAGYTYSQEEIYLEDGATEYTLEITKDAE